MATRVEIDISLPLGDGPDGHIALKADIPDLAALAPSDGKFIRDLIDKFAAWVPSPGGPAVPAVLKGLPEVAGGKPTIREGRRP